MKETLTIGSRGSQLALIQTNYVADLLRAASPGLEVNIEIISTRGDRIQDRPLAEIGGKGLFTEELEAALLEKRVDIAVHSLKDLPTESPEGLAIAASPERATPNDALVCVRWSKLEDLPDGATVGTSSLRRKAQLLALNPKLNIVDLRGNVGTRMGKVTDGTLDAAILACAGLERLGEEKAIAQVISPEIMVPGAGQGALGIQCRDGDDEVNAILDKISHADTIAEVTAERSLLAALGGGCQVPIGALAKVSGGTLDLIGCVASLDGQRVLRTAISGPVVDAADLGQRAADALIKDGADAIIEEVESRE